MIMNDILNLLTFYIIGVVSVQVQRKFQDDMLYLSYENATVRQGKTLAISCRDRSGQTVFWQGPRGPLGPYTRPKVMDSSIGKLLIFNNTKVDEMGNYTCSSLGRRNRKVFRLTVKDGNQSNESPDEPTFMNQKLNVYRSDEEIYLENGAVVNLTCEVPIGSSARFQWYTTDMNNRTHKIDNFVVLSHRQSILEVEKAPEIQEMYKCVAWSDHQKLVKRFNLHVGHRSEATVSVNLVNVTSDSLGLLVEDGDVQAVPSVLLVHYRRLDEDQWHNFEIDAQNGSFFFLENLEPATKYEIKISHLNSADLDLASNSTVYETLANTNEKPFASVSVLIFAYFVHVLYQYSVAVIL
ncbi:unnamed protein product [Callosobruchus maculatus]|uniref:Ig-like domain-containing protein n=2 Tax=Callosobruchus maculatus TaxID=64391 RepID=A0A653CY53_CALMS|nr:unnamed protein product [Callosobruchus maculatus]